MMGKNVSRDESSQFLNLVNSSGFLLQLALEKNISESSGHRFKVLAKEYRWRDPFTGEEKYIDLILKAGAAIWAVECKRPRGGNWVFLVPEDQEKEKSAVRCLWVAGDKGRSIAGLDDIHHQPPSPESMFCVVRGSGEGDRPMLERLANQVVAAVDNVASDDNSLMMRVSKEKGFPFFGFYVPVIVTTANLQVCRFDSSQVSLGDGTIPNGQFESFPMVRFRKTFIKSAAVHSSAKTLQAAGRENERTVLVINATSLIEILKTVKCYRDDWSRIFPWEPIIERLKEK